MDSENSSHLTTCKIVNYKISFPYFHDELIHRKNFYLNKSRDSLFQKCSKKFTNNSSPRSFRFSPRNKPRNQLAVKQVFQKRRVSHLSHSLPHLLDAFVPHSSRYLAGRIRSKKNLRKDPRYTTLPLTFEAKEIVGRSLEGLGS